MNMVKRVAGAIQDEAGQHLQLSDEESEMLARAALAAMHVPTKPMIEAGFRETPHDAAGCADQFDDDDFRNIAVDVWCAMIDEAQK